MKSIFPPYLLEYGAANAHIMLLTYKIHNKILFLGHSDAIDFWPFLVALKAAAMKILLNNLQDFFWSKVFYILVGNPTKFRD